MAWGAVWNGHGRLKSASIPPEVFQPPSFTSPHSSSAHQFLFFIPLPVCPWWCVGWREDEGRDGGCCNRELSSSLCRLVESQGDTMSGCADFCLFLLLLISLRRGTLLHLPHPRGAAGSQAAVPREHPGIKGCSQG